MAQPDFSIADVLKWARTKPAEAEYNYWCDRCAIGQFLVETRRAIDPTLAQRAYYDATGLHPIAPEINEAAYCEPESPISTFGAFVKRLEALLPAEPISDTWTKADAYLTDVEAVESVSL